MLRPKGQLLVAAVGAAGSGFGGLVSLWKVVGKWQQVKTHTWPSQNFRQLNFKRTSRKSVSWPGVRKLLGRS